MRNGRDGKGGCQRGGRMKREKGRQTIYLVAGLYLAYQGYSIFQLLRNGEIPPEDQWFMILFAAVFAVLGIGIAAVCGRRLYRMSKEERAGGAFEEPAPKTQETTGKEEEEKKEEKE